ncbi:MAG: Rne/Rng family ribonuclease [Acidobacteriota bacterium]|nr:Rne/Rng family ribonuclease [Acidobacteriota bacterium]
MTKELLISSHPHETKVAVLEDDQLVEVYFQRDVDSGLVGGIYKGRVNRVLPGMQSAFVDIGLDRDAFLYVSDFFEDSEEYDRVFTEAEDRVARASEASAGSATPPVSDSAPSATTEEPPAVETSASPAVAESLSAPTAGATPVADPAAHGATAPTVPRTDGRESRGRDFHGRRNRRRGRGFRDNRMAERPASTERTHSTQSEEQSWHLQPLPGESLSKYRGGEATDAQEPPPGLAADEAPVNAPTEENANPPFPVSEAEVGEAELQMGPQPESPRPFVGAEETISTDSLAESLIEVEQFEETYVLGDVESEDEGDTPSQLSEPSLVAPQDESSEDDFTEGELSGNGRALETPSHDSESEAASAAEKRADDLDSSQAASPAAAEAAPAPNSPAKPYTLRDSHQRQHVAPRRGRRGGRPFRGHRGRRPESRGGEQAGGGSHQPMQINELLKEGQEILVQIAKEPLGTKGARITSHIALPGRYLVYMPTISHIGVSRKIASDEERLRLRNILLENRGSLTGGFIVRTAGAGRSEEDLKADLSFLTNLWNDIRNRADRSKAPALIHRDLTLVERILRDLLSPDFKCVRVDNEYEYEQVLNFVDRFQPALTGHVKLFTRDEPLFEEFGAQAEIDKALKPKVWLKSGGYIVINQTEALVAIDVNTGKYVGKTNRLEDTIVRTNIDAVNEIVRQIRLRDLGGIIVIDFIDMDERRNRTRVVQALEEALRRDRAPTKILSFNEFGLVALTRKRAKQSLERALCEPCPYCAGAGWMKSVSTVSNEIVSEARKMASQIDGPVMTLRVNPQVAATLKSKAGAMISEIEAAAHKELVIKSDPAVPQERFEIF